MLNLASSAWLLVYSFIQPALTHHQLCAGAEVGDAAVSKAALIEQTVPLATSGLGKAEKYIQTEHSRSQALQRVPWLLPDFSYPASLLVRNKDFSCSMR